MREIVSRRGFLKAAAGGAALVVLPAAASGSFSRLKQPRPSLEIGHSDHGQTNHRRPATLVALSYVSGASGRWFVSSSFSKQDPPVFHIQAYAPSWVITSLGVSMASPDGNWINQALPLWAPFQMSFGEMLWVRAIPRHDVVSAWSPLTAYSWRYRVSPVIANKATVHEKLILRLEDPWRAAS